MYKKVYDFNQKRNQFHYDAGLEKAMYIEEKQEFYLADNLAKRVDAYCDCRYVEMGTQMKMDNVGETSMPYTSGDHIMYDIIESEIRGSNYGMGIQGGIPCDDNRITDKVISKAMKIVCECNELKTANLDENGKVSKQADLPNATELIAKMLEKMLSED